MVPFVASLLVTAGLAPLVRAQLGGRGFLDMPNHRSSHTVPVPRAGGLACLAGVLVGGLWSHNTSMSKLWVVLGSAVVLALLGLADDRTDLPPRTRLAAQACTGALAGLALQAPLLMIVGMLCVPTIVNAVNFMDGINGITAVTMTVWGASAAWAGHVAGSGPLFALGAATAGAALGFLPFNVLKPGLFLGDVGSYLFGGLVAAGSLLGWHEHARIWPLAAPLCIYAVDTSTTLVRRALRGERLTDAHRGHVYQLLTSLLGLPHLAVSSFAASLAAVSAISWWALPPWGAVVVTATVCGAYLSSPVIVRRCWHSRTVLDVVSTDKGNQA